MQSYHTLKSKPLNQDEIKKRYKETEEEMQEVLNWKDEEEDKLKKNNFKTHQSKSACKRALKKVARRIDSVTGMLKYWQNRIDGMSPFLASIELNEYWAMLKEKEKEKLEKEVENKLPNILKSKIKR